VAIPALDQRVSLGELEKAYSFDGPYFLLPNQFWTHKNHRVVIDALALLKRENEPFLVLATGPTNDYRNPAFFSTLMKHAANRDVVKEFRVLGHVPFDHLACLMRHAVAFINPSKFEGWSTSVEEAKSLGKQIVLSDIPVHLEQAPGRGFYFSEGDPEALAVSMRAARNQFDLRFDAEAQEAAQVLLPERKRRFGESYWRIVEKVLGR
jgi:glycosyltransferase involved in cell wall biosynthesis